MFVNSADSPIALVAAGLAVFSIFASSGLLAVACAPHLYDLARHSPLGLAVSTETDSALVFLPS